MGEFKDADGNTVEAFTPEEVKEKLNVAREEARAESETATEELKTQLQEKETDLETALKNLEAEKGKDKNLSGQRKIIEDKMKEVSDLKASIDVLKRDYDTKFAEQDKKTKDRMIGNMISELAGNDANLADKIKFYMDTFRPIDETGKKPEEIEKEIQERLKNAYTLATGGRSVPLSGAVVSSAGGTTPIINPTGEKLSSDQQDLARKLGIPDADLKKHKLI